MLISFANHSAGFTPATPYATSGIGMVGASWARWSPIVCVVNECPGSRTVRATLNATNIFTEMSGASTSRWTKLVCHVNLKHSFTTSAKTAGDGAVVCPMMFDAAKAHWPKPVHRSKLIIFFHAPGWLLEASRDVAPFSRRVVGDTVPPAAAPWGTMFIGNRRLHNRMCLAPFDYASASSMLLTSMASGPPHIRLSDLPRTSLRATAHIATGTATMLFAPRAWGAPMIAFVDRTPGAAWAISRVAEAL
mmetsp:Transcript_23717/g.43446  ORF Transcript_23717/g.43446 Transcript_23717/m.43446 type:complete len:248 (-) Transcript_23717:1204-1947(-)